MPPRSVSPRRARIRETQVRAVTPRSPFGRSNALRLAYLIVTHGNPVHLRRLIAALRTQGNRFFVHVDAKVDKGPFAAGQGNDVTFSETRFPVVWGEFSLVSATLELLGAALAHPANFDYFVLLSGSDYPLYTGAQINAFFTRHAPLEYLNIVPMPDDARGKPISRLTRFIVPTGVPFRTVRRGARKLLKTVGILPQERDFRKVLRELRPYGGSSWWALTRSASEHIARFTRERAEVVDFFRNTWCADEMLFHTILGNSEFASRIRRNLTYTRWASLSSPSPEWIGDEDLELFSRGPVCLQDQYPPGELIFARKFSEKAADVVDRMDQLIQARAFAKSDSS